MIEGTVQVKLVFADRGSFHEIFVQIPASVLERYERLIDALREDPEVTHNVHIDPKRLIAAYVEQTVGT
jgi:hypothetical protein